MVQWMDKKMVDWMVSQSVVWKDGQTVDHSEYSLVELWALRVAEQSEAKSVVLSVSPTVEHSADLTCGNCNRLFSGLSTGLATWKTGWISYRLCRGLTGWLSRWKRSWLN
jgi:hypothetical protein